jgi:hypothetical protein
MHAGAVHFDSLAVEVDYELSHLDNRLSVTLGAAHDGVDARHKFVLVEWLGHVVIGAEAYRRREPDLKVFSSSSARVWLR